MVEVAGIEPASARVPQKGATFLVVVQSSYRKVHRQTLR